MTGPRPYVRPWAAAWWLQRAAYRRYMLRELTCIPIAAWIAAMIVGLERLLQGPDAWSGFLAGLRSPGGLVLQAVVLAAVLYHTVTWFSLAPRTMPLRIRDRRISPAVITAVHYGLWVLLTAAILIAAGQ